MKLRTRALMYHDVARSDGGSSGLSGVGPEHYKLSWERFVEHLDWIERIAGASRSASDARIVLGETSFDSSLLTFDDGGASALEVGLELQRRNWQGFFFVTTGLIGSPGFVDAEAIRDLDRMGHVIGSHSVTHPNWMGGLPAAALAREWRESVDVLSELIGKPVRTASVPGGDFRRRVAAAAVDTGISTLFVSEPVQTVRLVEGCYVVGRYSIRRGTTGREAALAAAGNRRVWLRQYVSWNVRKPAKMLGEKSYDTIRRVVLARGPKERGP